MFNALKSKFNDIVKKFSKETEKPMYVEKEEESTEEKSKSVLSKVKKAITTSKINNTKFEDPTGLSANNVSTATDVLKLASKAFTYPNIKEATSHRNYSFRTIDSDRLINIKNTNDLIGGYLNIEAGKTGYIEAAGFCLVSEVSYEEQGPILVVVLGSDSHYARFSDLKAISTWIFNNYLWQ